MRKVLLIPVVAVLLGGCSIFSGDELEFRRMGLMDRVPSGEPRARRRADRGLQGG